MNTLFDTEEHVDRHDGPDAEFTLSTATLLGIFFALVLVCGVFFGFGYSMGRRSADSKSESTASATNGAGTATNSIASLATPNASHALPSQGFPSQAVAAATSTDAEPSAARPLPAKTASTPQPGAKPSAAKTSPTRTAQFEPPVTAPAVSPPAVSAPAMTGVMTGLSTPPQPYFVQIAAVSHQEDAEVLIAALKKLNYNVTIRHEPQDQLMHVQVGPFNGRADAVAMRQKLLADGYNAIVKP